jgi:hypothetical protein
MAKKQQINEVAQDMTGVPTAVPPVGQGFDGSSGRSAMMMTVMNKMATMPPSAMVEFYNQVMGQFGPENAPGEVDTSKQNQASIAAKGSPLDVNPGAMGQMVKEDLQAIFATDSTLSEEFKEKASLLFESAVAATIKTVAVKLEEENAATLLEHLENVKEELSSKVDEYLTFAAKKWLEENKLAVEQGLKEEVTLDFINGLKKLFKESYIEVPEEKRNLVGELETKVEELQTKLNEQVSETIKLQNLVEEAKFGNIIKEATAGLTALEVERFNLLVEAVEHDDVVKFQEKINNIKSTFFNKNNTRVKTEDVEGVITEETENSNANTVAVTGPVSKYVEYISKTIR